MNILFLTLLRINSLNDRGIYTDLLREFRDKGHTIFAVNPIERRNKKATYLITEKGVNIINVKTLNIQKTNVFEKGIATLSIEYQFLNAIKKYFKNQKFDIILYSTPPITFSGIISYIKQRDNAFSYLLLKDIFPQNAVDMEMIKKNSLIHKYFLKKERKLYELSDKIGCMSQANVDYITKHHSYLQKEMIEVNPNSIDPLFTTISKVEINKIRNKYNLPNEKKIFVYGGNLGKPQGLDFLIETIDKCNNNNAFFLIVGNGTKFKEINNWFIKKKPRNAKLIHLLAKPDFDKLLLACDVGMIFLHTNFTIPNFPSRLLSYLNAGLPVIAATDAHTDIGKAIEDANCGYWTKTGDIQKMLKFIDKFVSDDLNLSLMNINAKSLLSTKYDVKLSYKLIIESFNSRN
jgi:glycosyltransferase involved in cell wall biosynthesis